MISDAKFAIDLNLTECPFFSSCSLPKIHFLCRIPDCKTCPDFIYKLEKIK